MKEQIKSTYQLFTLGQKVWLKGRNLKTIYNMKITTKREGPFTILEVIPPVDYQLKHPDKWKSHDVFYATLLMPYKENNVHGPNYYRPRLYIINNAKDWEIE